MAGSFGHVDPEDGGHWRMLDNRADDFECIEELLWLVMKRIGSKEAKGLLHALYYPMERGELPPDRALRQVRQVMRGETPRVYRG